MQHEDEILLLPARQLVVTSVLNSGNGLHIIQLKENRAQVFSPRTGIFTHCNSSA